jgi:SAM-dependent methyltransferase
MPRPSKPGGDDVLAANRRFYDAIAGVYDTVDSRRRLDPAQHAWLHAVMDEARSTAATGGGSTGRFIDAGAGSGFLALQVAGMFEQTTLVDVSQAMLDRIDLPGAVKICSDVADIPLESGSADVIGAFATLHHLHDPAAFFREARRLLRPGGVLYTDHDIESAFVRNFRLPLKIHRALFDHGHGYLRACPSVAAQDYHLSEYHGDDGLSGEDLAASLRGLGFRVVQEVYHWEGMGPFKGVFDRLGLGRTMSRRGMAPIIRLIAVKEGDDPC